MGKGFYLSQEREGERLRTTAQEKKEHEERQPRIQSLYQKGEEEELTQAEASVPKQAAKREEESVA